MEIIDLMLPKNLENMSLPDPDLLDYYRLCEDRIFYLDTEIDESVLSLQRKILQINIDDKNIAVEDRKPIKILIDSPGGLLSETMSIASTISMSKTPVYTINVAEACSGAAIILMSGHKRFTLPYAICLIHSGSGGTCGTFEQTVEQQKNYQKQVNAMADFILNHSNIDEKTYKKNKTKEWYFSADDMVKYGVVDEIITDINTLLE